MEPNYQGEYSYRILDTFFNFFRYGEFDLERIERIFKESGFDKEVEYPKLIELLKNISPDMRFAVWPELQNMPDSWC